MSSYPAKAGIRYHAALGLNSGVAEYWTIRFRGWWRRNRRRWLCHHLHPAQSRGMLV